MFDTARQVGADKVLELARQVAAELAPAAGRSIRVVGWCGSTGKMGWEYVVEMDGHGWNLEVGDSDLLTFPLDERVCAEVEERIRQQMRYALETAGPSYRY
jgi:tripartite-type tricarboxylate transporter receptor subunit TctC